MPHSNQLEDQAKEFQVAVAFAWILLPLLRFVSGLGLFTFLNIFSWGFVHKPVEVDAKFLTRGGLDWVRVKGTCEHVIKVGHCSQGSVAHNNESVAVQRVQENDGHDFEAECNTVLDEANSESVRQASVLTVLLRCAFIFILVESPSLEMVWMIDGVLHDLHAILDLLGKNVVHVEARDELWNKEEETVAFERKVL